MKTPAQRLNEIIPRCTQKGSIEDIQLCLEEEMILTPKHVSNAFGLVPSALRTSFEWRKLESRLEEELHLIKHKEIHNAFSLVCDTEILVALLANSLSTLIHVRLIPQFHRNQALKIRVVSMIEAIRSNLYGFILAKISCSSKEKIKPKVLTKSDIDEIENLHEIRKLCSTFAVIIFEFFFEHCEALKLFSYSSSLVSDDQKDNKKYKRTGWLIWMGGYELLLSVPSVNLIPMVCKPKPWIINAKNNLENGGYYKYRYASLQPFGFISNKQNHQHN